jgi:DNA phosphorothioation-associated putative methyltransferase
MSRRRDDSKQLRIKDLAQALPGLRDRGRTAINRSDLSRPVTLALRDGLLDGASFFDFGCGRGGDVAGLEALGIAAAGWDPVHAAANPRRKADVVNFGYVANVIEDPSERTRALIEAWSLANKTLIVSARLQWEPSALKGRPHGDGLVTARGTFQRYFSHEELRAWIESTLGTESVAAAPGIFYVFRSEAIRQAYAASQFLARRSVPRISASVLLDGHRELLQPLISFLDAHGRVPNPAELENGQEVCSKFGSIDRAYRVVSDAIGTAGWEESALRRQRDLLVYVALSRFGRRPKLSTLPSELRLDIKALFGSYSAVCELADALLFSCGQRSAIDAECRAASVGKLTADALYVHISALADLSPLLRIYEGCARTLLGAVEGATIVKLRKDKPKISYLVYPKFDADGHPALMATFVADLLTLHTFHKDYSSSANPPVLHRKEAFVTASYPRRPEFEALTREEEAVGLLENPEQIGFSDAWRSRLDALGYVVQGNLLTTKG